jgi:hypothetical protein
LSEAETPEKDIKRPLLRLRSATNLIFAQRLTTSSLSNQLRLRSATNFGFAQQPTSASLSNQLRLRSATNFDFAQQPISTSLSNQFRLRSITNHIFAQQLTILLVGLKWISKVGLCYLFPVVERSRNAGKR